MIYENEQLNAPPFPARIERHILIVRVLREGGQLGCPSRPSKLACLFFREGDLLDLPLRASNEGSLRPRVARAQEIDRPPSPLPRLTSLSPHS